LRPDQARFPEAWPFYQTGQVRIRTPSAPATSRSILSLLDEIRPHIILVAGDLSDPHGTHRCATVAVVQAVERYRAACLRTSGTTGAWQEWSIAEADILVPLSEEELRRKISAIFKHQSQKDRAPFPGVDEREFWQRIEEAKTKHGALVDQLGLRSTSPWKRWSSLEAGRPGSNGAQFSRRSRRDRAGEGGVHLLPQPLGLARVVERAARFFNTPPASTPARGGTCRGACCLVRVLDRPDPMPRSPPMAAKTLETPPRARILLVVPRIRRIPASSAFRRSAAAFSYSRMS